jgi:hypothetical protein
MDVEPPPKYVNGELNSQIGIKAKIHILVNCERAPTTSMLPVGAAHSVKKEYM